MAATSMVSGSVVAAPLSATKLPSSAAFGASQAQFVPVCNVSSNGGRIVAVKASYSEEESSVSKRVLSSVLATGLAISLAGSAFAASGPGGDGAERTARKADELLQGADALIKNDSPQRFGPERGFGNGTSAEDVDRFSQKAGSGAIPDIQDATSAQVSGARDKLASNVKKTQRRIDGIWGVGKGMANDVVATAQGKADDAAKGAQNTFGQATKNVVASNVKITAGNVAADVKSKAGEVTAPVKSSGGGFFGKIKQQAKGIHGAVASKGADVKDAIPNVGK